MEVRQHLFTFRAVAACIASGASVLAFAAACSSGGTRVTGADDAASDADFPDSGGVAKPKPPKDASISRGPEKDALGWQRIDFDPGYECGFYGATSKEQLLPPIEWEPCTPSVVAAFPSCRQMKTDGPLDNQRTGFTLGAPSAMVDAQGKVWLSFARSNGPENYFLVAEADGEVHHGLHVRGSGGCRVKPAALAPGRVLYPVERTESQETGTVTLRSGAIGGAIDEPPLVLDSVAGGYRSFVAGPNAFFDRSEIKPWEAMAKAIAKLPENAEYLYPGTFVGDTLLYTPDEYVRSRVRVWEADAGAYDLLDYGDPSTAVATDFGTDGKDMVWVRAFGRTSTSDTWSVSDIVTAPFTLRTSEIKARRLRDSDPSIGYDSFLVGCGRAVRPSVGHAQIQILRLADGRQWTLEGIKNEEASYVFMPYSTLALSCDEIFIQILLPGTFDSQVLRIRLDELGPGTEAD